MRIVDGFKSSFDSFQIFFNRENNNNRNVLLALVILGCVFMTFKLLRSFRISKKQDLSPQDKNADKLASKTLLNKVHIETLKAKAEEYTFSYDTGRRVKEVLADPRFQENPEIYMEKWKYQIENSKDDLVERPAFRFFEANLYKK